MPPLQALVALHAFWAVLILPPAAWLAAHTSPARLRLIGTIGFWAGMVALVAVAAQGLSTWWESGPDFWRYAVQRVLFAVATATDVPCVQLAAAGMLWWRSGLRRTA